MDDFTSLLSVYCGRQEFLPRHRNSCPGRKPHYRHMRQSSIDIATEQKFSALGVFFNNFCLAAVKLTRLIKRYLNSYIFQYFS